MDIKISREEFQKLVNASVTEKLVPLLHPEEYGVSEFSGRVVFGFGENPMEECERGYREIAFFCGPEDKDGTLNDTYDGGCCEQLEKMFKDFPSEKICDSKYSVSIVQIGASENYHTVDLPDGITAQEMWELVRKRLLLAGAIEMETSQLI